MNREEQVALKIMNVMRLADEPLPLLDLVMAAFMDREGPITTQMANLVAHLVLHDMTEDGSIYESGRLPAANGASLNGTIPCYSLVQR